MVSLVSAELLQDHLPEGVKLQDLGEKRLKDLVRPERVFQVLAPDLPLQFPALKTLETLPNNLPEQLTSFIGREKEIEEVKGLLSKTRLLTILGAGGVGKTRLSLAIGAEMVGELKDGVWLVELAPLTDPGLLARTIAQVLSLKEESDRPAQATLIDHLKTRELLLIIDNCEHLVEVVARLSHELLKSTSKLKILATSREALQVAGEISWRVPSLSLPDITGVEQQKYEQLAEYEAIRLFEERARAVQPDFSLNPGNIGAVARVCYRLDGIPLALELAPARMRVLGVEQIATKLDDRFRLLTGGNKVGLPRQQTLRAAIDWSYDLLSLKERLLWQRLTVFSGVWSLEAAEAICGSDPVEEYEVLDLLSQLVEKSVVIAEKSERNSSVYRMLETLREYGWEILNKAGEKEELQSRHAHYFLSLAESLGQKEGNYQEEEDRTLGRMYSNIRWAMEWAIEKQNSNLALRIGAALGYFWDTKGLTSEGFELLSKALKLSVEKLETEERGRTLYWAAKITQHMNRHTESWELAEESLSVFRVLGNKLGIVSALQNFGLIAFYSGNNAESASYFQECLLLARDIGDKHLLGLSNYMLGAVALQQKDLILARTYFEEAQSIFSEIKDLIGVSGSISGQGLIALMRKDYTIARPYFEDSIQIKIRIGVNKDLPAEYNNLGNTLIGLGEYGIALDYFKESFTLLKETQSKLQLCECLVGIIRLLLRQSRASNYSKTSFFDTASLCGIVSSTLAAAGASLNQPDKDYYEEVIAEARAGQSEEVFNTAFNSGRNMKIEEVLTYVNELFQTNDFGN